MKQTLRKQMSLFIVLAGLFSYRTADAQTYVRYVTEEDLSSKVVYADSVLTSISLPRGMSRLDNYPKFNAAAYELSQVLQDPDKQLLQVWVCGSASPDGLWQYNVNLSRKRTEHAASYLKEVMNIPDSLIHKESLNEDWDRLAELVSASDIPCREQVLEIIRTKHWGARKTALQELQDGKVWDILVKDFFPKLRCVRFAIYCKWDPSKPHLSVPAEVITIRDTVTQTVTEIVTEVIKDTVYVRDTVVVFKEQAVTAPVVTKEQAYEEYRAESMKKRHIDWLRPNVMAVKTNLLSDAMAVPSLGLEFQLVKGLSLDLSGSYGFYNLFNVNRRDMQVCYASPELRWWFGENPLQKGSFIGLHGNVGMYTLEWRDGIAYRNSLDDLAWSAGFTYGAVACLDRKAHWGLEFVIGVGYGRYLQNVGLFATDGEFMPDVEAGPQFKEHFGITKLAVNLVYRFSLRGKNK